MKLPAELIPTNRKEDTNPEEMDKNKTTLTIEESRHLIDLGIDPKLAGKHTVGIQIATGVPHLYQRIKDGEPVFTIGDLLLILPREINHQCLTIISTDKRYCVFYGLWEREYIHSLQETVTPNDDCGRISAPELIDCLYKLLIWCLENNHIKLK